MYYPGRLRYPLCSRMSLIEYWHQFRPEPGTSGSTVQSINPYSDLIVSCEKVRDLLAKRRADKAAGVDELSPRLLLHFPDEILVPVCMLFEKSLREGRVPENWRQANSVPIYKSGDRGKAKNYRPVSLTCQLCKVFEKLVRDELVEHLESNGLLKGTWI